MHDAAISPEVKNKPPPKQNKAYFILGSFFHMVSYLQSEHTKYIQIPIYFLSWGHKIWIAFKILCVQVVNYTAIEWLIFGSLFQAIRFLWNTASQNEISGQKRIPTCLGSGVHFKVELSQWLPNDYSDYKGMQIYILFSLKCVAMGLQDLWQTIVLKEKQRYKGHAKCLDSFALLMQE